MLFSLLQVGEVQLHGFMPPQTASEQPSQKGTVAFTLQSLGIGTLPEGFALSGSQPVSQSHSEFLTPFTRRIPEARSGLSRPQSAAS